MKEFKAHLVRAGQDGPYSDSVYEYRIEVSGDATEDDIIDYCTTVVHKVDKSRRAERKDCNGHCAWPFGLYNFYALYRRGNDYYYTVVYPYND